MKPELFLLLLLLLSHNAVFSKASKSVLELNFYDQSMGTFGSFTHHYHIFLSGLPSLRGKDTWLAALSHAQRNWVSCMCTYFILVDLWTHLVENLFFWAILCIQYCHICFQFVACKSFRCGWFFVQNPFHRQEFCFEVCISYFPCEFSVSGFCWVLSSALQRCVIWSWWVGMTNARCRFFSFGMGWRAATVFLSSVCLCFLAQVNSRGETSIPILTEWSQPNASLYLIVCEPV